MIVLLLGMAIFAPLFVDEDPRDAYQMPRDLSAVAAPRAHRSPAGHYPSRRRRSLRNRLGARFSLQLFDLRRQGAMFVGLIVGCTAGSGQGRRRPDAVVDFFWPSPRFFPLAIAATLGPRSKISSWH